VSETIEQVKRPTSITVICVLAFIGAIPTVSFIFSPAAQQVGSWNPLYLGFTTIIGLACIVGLWMMRKWAAYTYTGFVALSQFVLLAMGAWHVMAFLIPAIAVFFALKHVSRMT